jgi:hypothetical protein
MQSKQDNKNEKPKFYDTKLLIAAVAVAVTVGFWNLFSNNAYTADKSSPSVVVTLPPQAPSVAADILPPLPTLVPLIDVTIPQVAPASDAVNVSQPDNQIPAPDNMAVQPQQSSPLRVVGVPTLVIVQKQKPVFGDQVNAAQTTDNSSSSSSSKSGGSSSKSSSSASTTKSSKK